MAELTLIQTMSADRRDLSVDAAIYTNGGTYHKVVLSYLWDDGRTERHVKAFRSRSKAEAYASHNVHGGGAVWS